MMRNKPWKLFGGDASAGVPRPPSRGPSSNGVGQSETTDRQDLKSVPVRGMRAEFAGFAEPVMVLDLDGRLIAANEAALALGRRLGAELDEGVRIEPLLAKARVTNGGGSPEWIPVPGGLDTLEAAAEPLARGELFELRSTLRNDADGRPVDWLVRLIDIAPLVAALQGQRAAAGHRDRLLKLLSHDMRTPLAAILATLKHPDLSAAPAHLRDVIESAAHRALSMVDSNVRLIRAQCSDYSFVEFDFCHVVEEAIDASWSLAKEAGIRIVLEPTKVPSPILADRGYLTEGLNELFANFIDRGVPSGILLCDLSLSTWHGKPAVTLNIREGAIGHAAMGESEVSRKLAAVTEHEGGGVNEGAGLDLFKTVVTRHGGTVVCERESDINRGVSVTIPSVGSIVQPS